MRRVVRMAKSEVPAMARQAWLVLRAREAVHREEGAARHIVLVHGFMAASGVLEPLRTTIERSLGLPVSTFGYSSMARFDATADRLAAFVDTLGAHHPSVSLVGHSLGGLLVRHCAQTRDPRRVVDRVVTIASPHEGTGMARLMPTDLGRAMRPGSEVLARLRERHPGSPPVHALFAEDDHLVAAERTALALEDARVTVLPGVGHNGVLYDPRAHAWLVSALSHEEPPASRADC